MTRLKHNGTWQACYKPSYLYSKEVVRWIPHLPHHVRLPRVTCDNLKYASAAFELSKFLGCRAEYSMTVRWCIWDHFISNFVCGLRWYTWHSFCLCTNCFSLHSLPNLSLMTQNIGNTSCWCHITTTWTLKIWEL